MTAAARTGAPDARIDEAIQLLERALSLMDECGLPAELGARLDEVVESVRQWQNSSPS